MAAGGKTFSCIFQIFSVFPEHFPASFLHRIHTGVYAAHKNIGGTAALVYSQKPYKQIPVYSVGTSVQKSRLRQRRQRFMNAVDHHVRPQIHRGYRKILRKTKMRSMSFVYDQRYSIAVGDLRNFPYIGNNAVVSRRSDQHGLNISVFLEASFHILRRNSAVYPHLNIFLWISIRNLQFS